jgi:hypothetical protein
MIIGLNTNIISQSGVLQKTWLQLKLQEVENNPQIDFVLLFFHHPPMTELWVEALTLDGGPNYVRNELLPIIKNYTKVQQISYGHTHAFERGTIESNSGLGDFRIVCNGGGGGDTDRWGEFTNYDYPQIHISLDHYFFQIMEIDVANKSLQSSIYSLGNSSRARNIELVDRWHRNLKQEPPETPTTYPPTLEQNVFVLHSSSYQGDDSLMTVRLQISYHADFSGTVLDTMVHWMNIYGVNENHDPVDLNENIDLTALMVKARRFPADTLYYYRVKYRDQNLKWSDWSNATSFQVATGIENHGAAPTRYELGQNFPNPFNPVTTIYYQIPKNSFVSLKVYDMLGKEVRTLVHDNKNLGRYTVEFDAEELSSGIYFYKIQADYFLDIKKLCLLK